MLHRGKVQIYKIERKKWMKGTLLVVQRLKFHTSNARGKGLIVGWGTKISHFLFMANQFKSVQCLLCACVQCLEMYTACTCVIGFLSLPSFYLLFHSLTLPCTFLRAQCVRNPSLMRETPVSFLDQEDLLKKG